MNTISTKNGTKKLQESDAERLAQLYSAEQDCYLSPAERDEAKTLVRREAARKLIEAMFHATGSSIELERALEGIQHSMCLVNSTDETRRTFGYIVGLHALLSSPDVVGVAIQLLLDELLATDAELRRALEALG